MFFNFFCRVACEVVKIKKWKYFVSLNNYKAKKQYNQGFGSRISFFEMFFKTGVLKNLAIFTGKHVRWSLQHTCFPVNVVKLLRTPFLQKTSGSCLCSKHIEIREKTFFLLENTSTVMVMWSRPLYHCCLNSFCLR